MSINGYSILLNNSELEPHHQLQSNPGHTFLRRGSYPSAKDTVSPVNRAKYMIRIMLYSHTHTHTYIYIYANNVLDIKLKH